MIQSRFFVLCFALAAGAMTSVVVSPTAACAIEGEEESCDPMPRCPDIYPSNVRAWHRVHSSHSTDTEFYLKAPHFLENGPKFGLGVYNFATSDEGKAPDGSFWKVVNSYYHARCLCIAGLTTVGFRFADENRWTIQQTRPAPPRRREDDSDEGSGSCDGDECDGGPGGGSPGGEAGYPGWFESPAPEAPSGGKWVCIVTDWYDGSGEYIDTTLDYCYFEVNE